MLKKDREIAAKKIISILSLMIYFFGSYGNIVFAQINLGFGSSVKKKFNDVNEMYNYTATLSPQDKFQFFNSSSVVCTRNGEKIFASENETSYRFLCFANNLAGINLQISATVLNSANGFVFVGYTASDENAIRYDGQAKYDLKFTVFNNSRTVFNFIVSSKNALGLDVNTNQGKIIFVNDVSEFKGFLANLHNIESVLFLKNAYKQIFGTDAVASYSAANVQGDNNSKIVLNALSSSEIFNVVNGQKIQKTVANSVYSLFLDAQSKKIVAQLNGQNVGNADISMSLVAAPQIPILNFTNITAINSTVFAKAILGNNSLTGQAVATNSLQNFADSFSKNIQNFFGNFFGAEVKAQNSGDFILLFKEQNGGTVDFVNGLVGATYDKPSLQTFSDVDSLMKSLQHLAVSDPANPVIAERIFVVVYDSTSGNTYFVDGSNFVTRYSGKISMPDPSNILTKITTKDETTIDLSNDHIVGILLTEPTTRIDFNDVSGIVTNYGKSVFTGTTTLLKLNINDGSYRILQTNYKGAVDLQSLDGLTKSGYLSIDSQNEIVGFNGDAKIISAQDFQDKFIPLIKNEIRQEQVATTAASGTSGNGINGVSNQGTMLDGGSQTTKIQVIGTRQKIFANYQRTPESLILDDLLSKTDAPVIVVHYNLIQGTGKFIQSNSGYRTGYVLVGAQYDLQHPIVEGYQTLDFAALREIQLWTQDLQNSFGKNFINVESNAEILILPDGRILVFDSNPVSLRQQYATGRTAGSAAFYNSNIPAAGRIPIGYLHTHGYYIADFSQGDLVSLEHFFNVNSPIMGVYSYPDGKLTWATATQQKIQDFYKQLRSSTASYDLNTPQVRSTLTYLDKGGVQAQADAIVAELKITGKVSQSTDEADVEIVTQSNQMNALQSSEVEILDEPTPQQAAGTLVTDAEAARYVESMAPLIEKTTNIVVLSDVRGYYTDAISQLQQIHAVDSAGNIESDNLIVQLGDIIDRAPSASEQIKIFDWVKSGVENGDVVYLLGNHEFGQVGGMAYGGMATSQNPGMDIVKPQLLDMFNSGKIKLAYAANDKLYIHAGLSQRLYDYLGQPSTAELAATKLNNLLDAWRANPTDPTLTQMVGDAVWSRPKGIPGNFPDLKTDLPFDEYTGHTESSQLLTFDYHAKNGLTYTHQGLAGWKNVDGVATNGAVHLIGDNIRSGGNGVLLAEQIIEETTLDTETIVKLQQAMPEIDSVFQNSPLYSGVNSIKIASDEADFVLALEGVKPASLFGSYDAARIAAYQDLLTNLQSIANKYGLNMKVIDLGVIPPLTQGGVSVHLWGVSIDNQILTALQKAYASGDQTTSGNLLGYYSGDAGVGLSANDASVFYKLALNTLDATGKIPPEIYLLDWSPANSGYSSGRALVFQNQLKGLVSASPELAQKILLNNMNERLQELNDLVNQKIISVSTAEKLRQNLPTEQDIAAAVGELETTSGTAEVPLPGQDVTGTVAQMENLAAQTKTQTATRGTPTSVQEENGITVISETTSQGTSLKISFDSNAYSSALKQGGSLEFSSGDITGKLTVGTTPNVGTFEVTYNGQTSSQQVDLSTTSDFSFNINGKQATLEPQPLTSAEETLKASAQKISTEKISATPNPDGTVGVQVGQETAKINPTTGTAEVDVGGAKVASASTGAAPAEVADLASSVAAGTPGTEVKFGAFTANVGGNIQGNNLRIVSYKSYKFATTTDVNGNIVGVQGTITQDGQVIGSTQAIFENGQITGVKTTTLDPTTGLNKVDVATAEQIFGTETSVAKQVDIMENSFKDTTNLDIQASLDKAIEHNQYLAGGVTDGETESFFGVRDSKFSTYDAEAGWSVEPKTATNLEAAADLIRYAGDALAMAALGIELAQVATGHMPIGLSTPQEFQNTVALGITATFAGIGLFDVATTLAAPTVAAEATAAIGISGIAGLGIGAAVAAASFAAIESAPFAYANQRLTGNSFVSPTGVSLATQTFNSVEYAFSGQTNLVAGNGIFNQIYAQEYQTVASKSGVSTTGTKTITSRYGGEAVPQTVDVTSSISQIAFGNAQTKFLGASAGTINLPGGKYAGTTTKTVTTGDLWNQLATATDSNQIASISKQLSDAYGKIGIAAPPNEVTFQSIQNLKSQQNANLAQQNLYAGKINTPAQNRIGVGPEDIYAALQFDGQTIRNQITAKNDYLGNPTIGEIVTPNGITTDGFVVDTNTNTLRSFDGQVVAPYDSISGFYKTAEGVLYGKANGIVQFEGSETAVTTDLQKMFPGGVYEVNLFSAESSTSIAPSSTTKIYDGRGNVVGTIRNVPLEGRVGVGVAQTETIITGASGNVMFDSVGGTPIAMEYSFMGKTYTLTDLKPNPTDGFYGTSFTATFNGKPTQVQLEVDSNFGTQVLSWKDNSNPNNPGTFSYDPRLSSITGSYNNGDWVAQNTITGEVISYTHGDLTITTPDSPTSSSGTISTYHQDGSSTQGNYFDGGKTIGGVSIHTGKDGISLEFNGLGETFVDYAKQNGKEFQARLNHDLTGTDHASISGTNNPDGSTDLIITEDAYMLGGGKGQWTTEHCTSSGCEVTGYGNGEPPSNPGGSSGGNNNPEGNINSPENSPQASATILINQLSNFFNNLFYSIIKLFSGNIQTTNSSIYIGTNGTLAINKSLISTTISNITFPQNLPNLTLPSVAIQTSH